MMMRGCHSWSCLSRGGCHVCEEALAAPPTSSRKEASSLPCLSTLLATSSTFTSHFLTLVTMALRSSPFATVLIIFAIMISIASMVATVILLGKRECSSRPG